MSMRARGFTLIELLAVISILGVLAAIAVPQYFDHRAHAHYSSMMATTGAVQQGIRMAELAYATGSVPNLPPDADSNGFLDNLGDVAAGEPTLFDAVLDPPVVRTPGGWKEWPTFPLGVIYAYYYDADDDDVFDAPTEVLIFYNNTVGTVGVVKPPAP